MKRLKLDHSSKRIEPKPEYFMAIATGILLAGGTAFKVIRSKQKKKHKKGFLLKKDYTVEDYESLIHLELLKNDKTFSIYFFKKYVCLLFERLIQKDDLSLVHSISKEVKEEMTKNWLNNMKLEAMTVYLIDYETTGQFEYLTVSVQPEEFAIGYHEAISFYQITFKRPIGVQTGADGFNNYQWIVEDVDIC